MHKQLVLTANMFMLPTSIYQKIDFLAFPCYLPLEGYLLPSLLGVERVPGDKSQPMPMTSSLTGLTPLDTPPFSIPSSKNGVEALEG